MGNVLIDSLIYIMRPHWFRGKARLLNSLIPDKGERRANIFGYKTTLDLSDYGQRHIFLGTYEPVETSMVKQWLKPGMTFLDIGANVGYYTALAAALVGSEGRILALEPSLYAYHRLKLFLKENDLSQVIALSVGASSTSGEAPLYLPPDSAHNHSPTMTYREERKPVRISLRTIDDCLEQYGINHVDLLKLDIEGHEMEALKGALKAIKSRKIKAILCEFNDFWLRSVNCSPLLLYNFLVESGFRSLSGPALFPSGCLTNHFFVLENKIT